MFGKVAIAVYFINKCDATVDLYYIIKLRKEYTYEGYLPVTAVLV